MIQCDSDHVNNSAILLLCLHPHAFNSSYLRVGVVDVLVLRGVAGVLLGDDEEESVAQLLFVCAHGVLPLFS